MENEKTARNVSMLKTSAEFAIANRNKTLDPIIASQITALFRKLYYGVNNKLDMVNQYNLHEIPASLGKALKHQRCNQLGKSCLQKELENEFDSVITKEIEMVKSSRNSVDTPEISNHSQPRCILNPNDDLVICGCCCNIKKPLYPLCVNSKFIISNGASIPLFFQLKKYTLIFLTVLCITGLIGIYEIIYMNCHYAMIHDDHTLCQFDTFNGIKNTL